MEYICITIRPIKEQSNTHTMKSLNDTHISPYATVFDLDSVFILHLLLTTQFDPYEVFDAQVFQEHTRRGRGFKQEGDISTQLSVEGGKVKVRRLLVEKRSVPEVL